MSKVLVIYASKHGSTQEIAETIAAELTARGLEADLHNAEAPTEITAYDAVVVGSAIYAGNWLPAAVQFVKENVAQLAQRPVWVFSSGPLGEGPASELVDGWTQPRSLDSAFAQIVPRDVTVFHGKIDFDSLSWGERLIFRAVRGQTGDFRDWEAIRAWAGEIATALQSAPQQST